MIDANEDINKVKFINIPHTVGNVRLSQVNNRKK